MCGIYGIFDPNDTDDRLARVQRAAGRSIHRGPDDEGHLIDPPLCFGMRRLAIIDLLTGQQPIFNENRSLAIVLNGEIYNYRELRAELETRGHVFSTQSDTEAILHLYEECGPGAASRLVGMFSFCVWDRRKQEIFLARDRFGEKPLHYHFDPAAGRLAFASEIPALLELVDIPRRLDPAAFAEIVALGFAHPPATGLQGIAQLPPAHWALLSGGQLRVERYWELKFNRPERMDIEEAQTEVERLLRQAVRRQMIADVPLGAFLSGGIDSSLVCMMLAAESSQKVRAFTVRFPDRAYDESPFAEEVARRLGLDHTVIEMEAEPFTLERLRQIVRHLGAPMMDSSVIPTLLISEVTRKHVTVALAGDGGDELFCGYPDYQWGLQIDNAGRIPGLAALGATGVRWASTLYPDGRLRRLRRGLDCARQPQPDRFLSLYRLFDDADLNALLGFEAGRCLYSIRERWSAYVDQPEPLLALQSLRANDLLPDDMLVKVDRMAMAASLEVRAPFLDHELAEFSARLPTRFKLQNGVGKVVLRRILQTKIPAEVLNRPKQGFSIPLRKWMNAEFVAEARRLFDSPAARHLFPGARSVLAEGLDQTTDRAWRSVQGATTRLWHLMVFLTWLDEFGIDPGEPRL